MKLPDYIKKHGDAECSRRWQIKERTVASWRRCERVPRPQQARIIVAASGGEVSMNEIYAASLEAA